MARRRKLWIPASLLLVLAAAGIGIRLYLASDHFHRWLRATVTQALESRFPVQIRLGSLEIGLLRGVLEIQDLVIAGKNQPEGTPAIHLDRVRLNFSWLAAPSPKIGLDELEVDGLDLQLRREGNGRLNILNLFAPAPKPGGPVFSPVRLGIGRIVLTRARVTYEDQTVEFATDAGGFDVELAYLPDPPAYAGSIHLKDLVFQIKDYRVPLNTFAARFRLSENRLDLDPADLASDLVAVHLEGSIHDLRELAYSFAAEIRTDPSRFTDPDLASHFGPSEVTVIGELEGRRGDFELRGHLTSPRIEVQQIGLSDFRCGIMMNRQGVRYHDAAFRILGGTGGASGYLAFSDEDVSSAQLRAVGIQLQSILTNWGVRFPLARAAGDLTAEVSWAGLDVPQMRGQGALTCSGSLLNDLGGKLVEFNGGAEISIAGDHVRAASGSLRTPQGVGEFTAEVDFDGAYRVSGQLAWPQGDEVEAILYGWELIPTEEPFSFYPRLEGPLEATVLLEGAPGDPLTAEGRFRAAGTLVRGRSWGAMAGSYRYREDRLAVSGISIDGSPIHLTGSLDLRTDPFSLAHANLEIRDTAADLLLDLAAVDWHLESGRIWGTLEWSAEEGGKASGELEVRSLALSGFPEVSLRSRYRFGQGRISADALQAEVLGGQVRGRLRYILDDRTMEAELQGEALDLAQLPWQETLPVSGRADIQLHATGSLESPQLSATLTAPAVQLGGHRIETVRFRGEPFQRGLRGELEFHLLGEPLHVTGTVGFDQGYPFRLELPLKLMDPGELLRRFRPDLDLPQVEGELRGRLTVEGQLEQREQLRAELLLEHLRLGTSTFQLSLESPVQLRWSDGVLRVPPARLVGTQTNVALEGSVEFGDRKQLDLAVAGKVDLQLLDLFLPEVRTTGEVQLETRIAGPLDGPRVVGTARVSRGTLAGPELPLQVQRADGNLRFTATQIAVDDMLLQTTYGPLTLTGGIFLEGLTPTRWQLNAFGYGLTVPYPKDVNTVVDVDLDLIRNLDSYLLAGVIYVRAAEYTRNLTVPELIYSFASAQTDLPSEPTFADQVGLDLTVEAYQSLRINNNLARIVGSGELSVIGTLGEPVVLGSITIDEGNLRLEGNDYEITRGTVSFNNPRRTTPFLNFEAETQVREFAVTLSVRGPVDQFQINFRSDPPLSTPSIVSLLAAGQTQEEIFGTERADQTDTSTLMAYSAGTLLSKTLGEVVENQTSRLFGFERFSIDPFVDDTRGRDPGARITLGKQLTRELGITYISSLGNNFQDQTVIIQYRLTDWLTAVGSSSPGEGTIAVDFKIKKRF
jgi:translocation and assembly module TamB